MGWTEEVEETPRGSSIKEEHRALMGTALESYRSAGAVLHEVFKNLAAGFEVQFLRFHVVYLSLLFLLVLSEDIRV